MKDKPLVIIITLLGGAVCSICCILKRAGLLWTLLATFITLVVFMIIGMIINRFYTEVKNEVIEADKERERLAEEDLRGKKSSACAMNGRRSIRVSLIPKIRRPKRHRKKQKLLRHCEKEHN